METTSRPPGRFWLSGRFTPRQVDWMVAAAAFVLSGPALAHIGHPTAAQRAVGVAMLPIGAVPLLWRRTKPGWVLAAVAVAFGVSAIFGSRGASGPALAFGVFAASLYGSRRVRIIAGAVALGALIVAFSTVLATGEAKQLGRLAGPAFGSGLAWVAADRTRSRRAYLGQLEERASRLEREREENARRATEEERNRIARELHDVVAHSVSVIAVQAGAARTTSSSDPARAAETLGLIERTARSTLSELRALLGVLRKSEDVPLWRPQPTLEQLDGLVQHAREAGISVEVLIEGDVHPLPAVVDLCAYRVLQEALTNVIKHAPNARARVSLRYGTRELLIGVVDDGPGANGADSSGHGLIGMRERVGLLGGEIHTGPANGGGFRVEVRLPIVEGA